MEPNYASAAAAASSSSVATTSRQKLDEPSTDAHVELLTEHFGFNPRVFIDALVYAANEHLYSMGAQLEEFVKGHLRKEYGKRKKHLVKDYKVIADMEAEKAIHTILTLFENTFDHIFDLLELYCLKAVFGIRPSQAKFMTLAHHQGLDLRTVEEKLRSGGGGGGGGGGRGDGAVGSLDPKEESERLETRQRQLLEQIAKAKKLRHALRLAQTSAKQNLKRAQQISETFSPILSSSRSSEAGDGGGGIPLVLPQSARKLTLDATSLLHSIGTLIATDSLGSSLLVTSDKKKVMGAKESSEKDRKRAMDESGASEAEKRAWKGREGYLKWEIDRMVQNARKQQGARRTSHVGNLSTASVVPSAKKRRKTVDNTGELASIGTVSDLQQLAEHLQAD